MRSLALLDGMHNVMLADFKSNEITEEAWLPTMKRTVSPHLLFQYFHSQADICVSFPGL